MFENRVFLKSCESMSEIPDGAIDACVTSPPYWGLRDYGTARWEGGEPSCEHVASERYYTERSAASASSEAWSEAGEANAERIRKSRWRESGFCTKCGAQRIDEQVGLEETPQAYVDRLVGVFREVKRVLRDDGTLWINIGDSYAGSWGAQSRGNEASAASTTLQDTYNLSERQIVAHPKTTQTGSLKNTPGLKSKDLVGIPWMVAFALRDDGWYLRSDIIWHKKPCMPSSVADRCTTSHEYVFMLSKSRRYYFDADSIREPLAESSIERLAQDVESQEGSTRANAGGKTNGNMKAVARRAPRESTPPRQTMVSRHGNEIPEGLLGANKRDVWTIAPAGYSGAHFAVMPRELARLCILAGSSSNGVVLDPFMGSGTVAEVAIGSGRRFTGYELNPEYHKLIQERLGLFGAA